MKNLLWAIAGFCAAAVGLLVWNSSRPEVRMQRLVRRLEEAWADNQTAV